MPEIDNLEIRIEASAKSANNTLDEMSKKLDSVAESIKKVLPLSDGLKNIGKIDSNEIKNVKKQLDSIEKSVKKTSEKQVKVKVDDKGIKKSKESLDDLFDRFSKAGIGLDVSKLGFQELIKASKKADLEVQRLNDRLEKKISVEGTDNIGKAWENLVYDIQKATNQADAYREALNKVQNVKPNIHRFQNDDSKSKEDANVGKTVPVKDESAYKYNAELMANTFGEAARNLETYSDVVEKLGVSAGIAGQKLNEFEEKADTKKIQTYAAEIKNVKKALAELANQGLHEGDSDYDKKARELSLLTERQKEYNRANRQAAKSVIKDEQTSTLKKMSSTFKNVTGETKKFASSFKKTISTVGKASSVIKKAINSLGKLKNSIVGVRKQSDKGMNLGRMIGSSIAFSTVFQAISLIKQAIAEGSKNLTQYSGEYNNSISSMVSSLLYLKNAWAAAFAPIVNVVAPYISSFINMLSSALNKVGQFFAALTGKTVAVQSKKVWKDYGSSLKNVGSGASDASKGLNDAAKSAKEFQDYTLGIDELNIQPKADANTSGSGAGGSGSGGGGGTELSPQDMFETVDVTSGVSEFSKKVKEAWEKADFTEIGHIIGNKLNSALESIPWESIQETSWRIGKSIATLLNGIVETDGLGNTIGESIGEAINSGIIGVNSFLDNTHWDSVGKFLGDGLNGVVNTINFEKIGHFISQKWNAIFETIGEATRKFDWKKFGKEVSDGFNTAISDFKWEENAKYLSDLVKGLLDSIIVFLENTNWQELGDNIATFIGTIDWSGITVKLAEGIGATIGGLSALLWGFIEDAWNSVVDWWKEVAYEDGQFTIGGLLQGIVDVVSNIGKWIKEHIFQPFIDGFKKAFGIHSPSTVMAEQGNFIMQGLFDGVSEKFEKITGIFNKIMSKIQEIFSPIVNWFKEKFTKAYEGVKNAWSSINTWFKGKWDSVKGVFKDVTSFFKTGFEKAYKAVTDVWDGIKSYFVKVAGWIIEPIEKAVNGVREGINWVFKLVGADEPYSKPWSFKGFATGSNGLPSDTIGVVNDQAGSTYKELIVPPHGKPFIPEGRNVMLPMEKGTKIMPAGQTKALMNGMPKFKNGIGEFFGNAWSKVKDFTGDVMDYITHPSKILQIAIDKFTDFSGITKFFIPLATGAVSKVFDSAVGFIQRMFDKTGGTGIEKALRWAVGIANDNSHGYDQARRTGPDYDCSSLVTTALKNAGFKIGIGSTSTMLGQLTSAGFKNVNGSVNKGNASGMKRGDILLTPGRHTAMYLGNGQIVHASINEFGRITGGKPGDQTGKEICVKKYYNYPWSYVMRYAKGFKNGIGRIGMSDLIPKYSVGGFPEDGLFMANHNELVGQFSDGRTAVANNLDIQKGIEEAAYRGFSRANADNREEVELLRELIRAVRNGKRIVVDGRELVSVTDSRRGRNGYSFT